MPLELGRKIPYDIHIRPSDNMGFIVKIGCGEFVTERISELVGGIVDYLENPLTWERRFNERSGRGSEAPEITRE